MGETGRFAKCLEDGSRVDGLFLNHFQLHRGVIGEHQ